MAAAHLLARLGGWLLLACAARIEAAAAAADVAGVAGAAAAAGAAAEDAGHAPARFLQPRANGEQRPASAEVPAATPAPAPAAAPSGGQPWTWAGANSYYLWALADGDVAAVLDAMQRAQLRVLRIFVVTVEAPKDGTSASTYYDIEHSQVGNFSDSSRGRYDILDRIDLLMLNASSRGIKLDIALHDRYSLGVYKTDAYVTNYQLKPGAAATQNLTNFYDNAAAQTDFDNRLQFLLRHPNPYMGNVPWGKLGQAILTVGVQNEGQGHLQAPDMGVNDQWWCDRAKAMAPYVGGGVRISTGGSWNILGAVKNRANYNCKYIDIVSIHSYDWPGTNDDHLIGTLNAAVGLARAANPPKRVIFEEFGAPGTDQLQRGITLGGWMAAANSVGVPFLPWQLMKPGNACPGYGCYNFWTVDESWVQLSKWSTMAGQTPGRFQWPELEPPRRPDGKLCSFNGECEHGCCSWAEAAARAVCVTASGNQSGACTGAKLKPQAYCTLNSQCDTGCCSNGAPKGSNSYSRFLCVPSGSPYCTGFYCPLDDLGCSGLVR